MVTKGVVGRDLYDEIRGLEVFLESAIDDKKRKELERKIKKLKDRIEELGI